MRSLLFLAFAVLLIVCAICIPRARIAATTAYGGSIAATPGVCPRRGYDGDGCAGAPGNGSFRLSGAAFLAVADPVGNGSSPKTSIISTHPEPWNVAGWDYPVGYLGSQPALADPAAAPPAHCRYANNALTCSDPNADDALTISGLDFSLHGGVSLVVESHNAAALVVQNDYFKRGQANAGAFMIHLQGGAYNFTFTNNTWDGGGFANRQIYTNKNGHDINDARTDGNTVILYSAITNIANRFIGWDHPGNLTVKWNYFQDWGLTDYHHNEIFGNFPRAGTTMGAVDVEFNTTVVTSRVWASSNTAPFYFASAGRGNAGFASVVINGNTVINNPAGGCFGAYACHGGVTVTGFIDDGAGAGSYDGVAGDVLTITSGQTWPDVDALQSVTGAGVALSTSIASFGKSPTQWIVKGGQAVPPATLSLSPTLPGANNTSVALVEFSAPYVTGDVSITNNFVDAAGTTGCLSRAAVAGFDGFIDDGAGGGSPDGRPGTILTVTKIKGDGVPVLVGATVANNNGLPIASDNPAPVITGQLNGPANGAGAYRVSGAAVSETSPGYPAGEKWQTTTAIGGTLTINGNYSLYRTNDPITPGGPQWNSFQKRMGDQAACDGRSAPNRMAAGKPRGAAF